MQGLVTAEQLRAARAILGFSVSFVAKCTAIGTATLKRYEAVTGVPRSRKGHLQALSMFYEQAGIEFIGTPDDGPGIRLRKPTAAATTQSLRAADAANTPDGQE